MKKMGIKLGSVLVIIVVLMIYLENVQEDRFNQRKEKLLAKMTSNLNVDEAINVYVFGEDGDISRDFEQKISKIHIQYGNIIGTVTGLPYSNTSDTPYSKYLDINKYPMIIVLNSKGIINRSYSPGELKNFLSSIAKFKGVIHDINQDIVRVDCSDAATDNNKSGNVEAIGYLCSVEVSEKTLITAENGESITFDALQEKQAIQVVLERPHDIGKTPKSREIVARKIILLNE